MSYYYHFFLHKYFLFKTICSAVDGFSHFFFFFYIEFLQPLKKSSHKNPRSEDALTPLLYFVGVRLRQMCNCVICSRPCQSNTESAGMHVSKHLWHAPMLRIALVTWHGCFESRFGAVFRNICASGSRHRVETSVSRHCAFTPQAARASKWPEVIHFQWEPAASSGESVAARFGRWERRGELKSSQLHGNELWRGSAATNRNVEVLRLRGVQRTQSCKLWFRPH